MKAEFTLFCWHEADEQRVLFFFVVLVRLPEGAAAGAD